MNEYDVFIFSIEDKNTYYANSLRRIMMSDVPTLAIDTVNIAVNTSILTDEILSHRLGLVVIDSEILDKDVASNEGIHFSLDAICEEDEMYITAEMIKIDHPDVLPVHKDTIICKMYKGDEIQLTGTIKKGIGRTHAKWMPVSVIGYNIEKADNDNIKIYLSIEPVGNLKPQNILRQAEEIIKTRQEKFDLNKFKTKFIV